MTNAAIVQAAERVTVQPRDGGSQPTSPLQSLQVKPIPLIVAKKIVQEHHYLHSLPGGTKLSFGVFLDNRLAGALTLGVGPANGHCLVEGASPDDCLTLTRLWLSGELPKNSESRVIGIVLRSLRKNTRLKFLLSYADPAQGHLGAIYQAARWLYTGLSSAMPLYDLGDGIPRHSRSVAQILGSHSIKYMASIGLNVRMVSVSAKHRYVYFLDKSWQAKLRIPVLPYPKKELTDGSN